MNVLSADIARGCEIIMHNLNAIPFLLQERSNALELVDCYIERIGVKQFKPLSWEHKYMSIVHRFYTKFMIPTLERLELVGKPIPKLNECFREYIANLLSLYTAVERQSYARKHEWIGRLLLPNKDDASLVNYVTCGRVYSDVQAICAKLKVIPQKNDFFSLIEACAINGKSLKRHRSDDDDLEKYFFIANDLENILKNKIDRTIKRHIHALNVLNKQNLEHGLKKRIRHYLVLGDAIIRTQFHLKQISENDLKRLLNELTININYMLTTNHRKERSSLNMDEILSERNKMIQSRVVEMHDDGDDINSSEEEDSVTENEEQEDKDENAPLKRHQRSPQLSESIEELDTDLDVGESMSQSDAKNIVEERKKNEATETIRESIPNIVSSDVSKDEKKFLDTWIPQLRNARDKGIVLVVPHSLTRFIDRIKELAINYGVVIISENDANKIDEMLHFNKAKDIVPPKDMDDALIEYMLHRLSFHEKKVSNSYIESRLKTQIERSKESSIEFNIPAWAPTFSYPFIYEMCQLHNVPLTNSEIKLFYDSFIMDWNKHQ